MTQEKIPTVGAESPFAALRLDVPTIQARTASYPEDLREHVLWLANYVREECARDLDILCATANKLGISFDKTTWGKILRGLLQRDSQGVEQASPIVNVGKLTRAIESLRKDSLLREMAGRVPYVMTPTGETMFNFVDKKRAPDRVNKFGMIVGHTGRQKTATLKEYCRRNNHGTCVRVEAPETASHTQFITDLAEKYGCSRQATWDRKRNTIRQSVNDKRTIIVENVQRLYDERQGGNQKVFSYLQKLQDDTDCTVILTLTPVFASKLRKNLAEGYFEQFIGRAGGEREILTLEEFSSEEDVEVIAKSFGLEKLSEKIAWGPEEKQRTGTALEYLAAIARESGRDRVLFEALQEARVIAGKKDLNINHVRVARGED